MYEEWLKYQDVGLRDEDGVIVGADVMQEWILPWWWENYSKHNALPVAFFDFGMSLWMKKWCKERGELIPIPIGSNFVAEREEIDPSSALKWEKGLFEKYWEIRQVWFKKPFASIKSPFQRTIWSDLDCEIICSLDPLFAYSEKEPNLSLCSYEECQTYNSGIVVFKRGATLVEKWVENALFSNHLFRGDEELLTYLIQKERLEIDTIPLIYNWDYKREDHSPAKIIHWYGPIGKQAIYNKINHGSRA